MLKEGSWMLASTAGIPAASTFNINSLQGIKDVLVGLPRKPKTQYAMVEAESFLHRWVHSTLRKNYSVAEIDGVFLNAGWSEEQRKAFWIIFGRKEDKRGNKKIAPIRMSRKKAKAISHEETPQENSASQSSPGDTVGNTSAADGLTVQSIAETQQPLSGAHFELPPDTEDI